MKRYVVATLYDNDFQQHLSAGKNDSLVLNQNPSPEVQMAAVQQDMYAIHYIADPTPEVQMAAVQQGGNLITYIANPTPEVQMAAVQRDICNKAHQKSHTKCYSIG